DAEARRLARVRFGSTAAIADRCRDLRGIGGIETLWQDARYAVRSFRRAPTFALTVVGTIAIGLGLNTAVFTIFNTYVLKPLDVRDPYALYQIDWTARAGYDARFTWTDYQALPPDRTAFSAGAAW